MICFLNCWRTLPSLQFIEYELENTYSGIEMLPPGYIVGPMILFNSHLNILEWKEGLLVNYRAFHILLIISLRRKATNFLNKKGKTCSQKKKKDRRIFLTYSSKKKKTVWSETDASYIWYQLALGRTAHLNYADLQIQAISRYDMTAVAIRCIFGTVTVSMICEAEGLLHWFQEELMAAEQPAKLSFQRTAEIDTSKADFSYSQVCSSVNSESLRLFLFWLQKCFPTGLSSEVRFTRIETRVGHWDTNLILGIKSHPQLYLKVRSAHFPCI